MSKDLDQIFAVRAEPLEGEWIRVEFSNGAIHDIGVRDLLARGGVFERIRKDRGLFEQVRVNPDSRAVEWPEEIDLDSEVLYGLEESAFGTRFRRCIVRNPTPSAA
jgi:Protein of unknown function (DUF2442)